MSEEASTPVPKRRFELSLRTLLVGVTLLGGMLGWVCYQLNWIQQRHALLIRHGVMRDALDQKLATGPNVRIGERISVGEPTCSTPGQLWLFGESPVPAIDFAFLVNSDQTRPNASDWNEVQRVRDLFPEAEIEWRLIKLRSYAPGDTVSTGQE